MEEQKPKIIPLANGSYYLLNELQSKVGPNLKVPEENRAGQATRALIEICSLVTKWAYRY